MLFAGYLNVSSVKYVNEDLQVEAMSALAHY